MLAALALPVLEGADPRATTGALAENPPCIREVEELLESAKFPEAIARGRECLAEAERVAGPVSMPVALAIDRLVDAISRHGRRDDEGITLARRSLAIKEVVLGPDHVSTGTSLRLLGRLVRDESPRSALAHFERALAIDRKAVPPDTLETVKTLDAIGETYARLGADDSALVVIDEALRLASPAGAREPLLLAKLLSGRGRSRHQLGQLRGAIQDLRAAVDGLEAARGPDDPAIGTFLVQLANVLRDAERHAEARPMYERALALTEAALGADHPSVATALSNLAMLERLTGNGERARSLYERALSVRERALGPNHPVVATTLLNSAWVLLESSEDDSASARFERARAILDRVYGKDYAGHLPCLRGLATIERRRGRFDAAEKIVREQLRIIEANASVPPVHHVRSLRSLGALELARGNPRAAISLFEESLAEARKRLGVAHAAIPHSLRLLGAARWAEGSFAQALDAFLESHALGEQTFRLNVRSTSERGALAYRDRSSDLDPIVSLTVERLRSDPASVTRAFEAVVRSRAIVLDELAARHRTLLEQGAAARAARDSVEAARQELLRLFTLGGGSGGGTTAEALRAARARLERGEERLGRTSEPFRWIDDQTKIGLAEVRRALPPDAALVSFVSYHRTTPAHFTGVERVTSLAYAAFVLRGTGAPILVPLLDQAELRPLADAWREGFQPERMQSSTGSSEALEHELRRRGVALRRVLWDPIAALLGHATRVFVVPDGLVNFIDFAALPDDRTGYLVEASPILHFLTTERDLAARPSNPGVGLLALGDPAFETARPQPPDPHRAPKAGAADLHALAACEPLGGMEFAPLRAAGRELERVEAAWRARPGAEEVVTCRLDHATEADFRRSAPRKRVVHLATHAFSIPDRCEARSSDEEEEPRSLGPPASLLGGIALAGANASASAESTADDGILFTEEIADLDLRGVECVVLSACETGSGEAVAGEGVMGLRRAFQIAGAATIVSSLRAVDDATAAAWMEAFYDARFHEGKPIAEAVRHASLARLADRRARGLGTHPYYWGGFIATGAWR